MTAEEQVPSERAGRRAGGSQAGRRRGAGPAPPEFAEELWACIHCNYCGAECPTAREAGWESTSPRGKIRAFQRLRAEWDRRGRVEPPPRFVEAMYECTSCDRCTAVCHVGIDFLAIHERWREWLARSGHGPLKDHGVLVGSLRNYRNPFVASRRDRARWADGLDLPRRGKVLFFAGCSDSFVHPEVARATVVVLRSLGHDLCYLGEDEPCCGSTAARLGMEGDLRDLAVEVTEAVATTGAELVVTACPGCSSAFREYYPGHGLDLGARVLHVTEVLDQALADGRLEVRRRLPGRWTYYDPCHLGRVDGVYEPPRRVLRACVEQYVPLPRERAESLCCGAGGGYRTAFPSKAASVGGRVVEMAEDVDARVVTACPWCETNIGEAAAASQRPGGATGPGNEVLDIVQVVQRAMGLEEGEEPERPKPRRAPGRLV